RSRTIQEEEGQHKSRPSSSWTVSEEVCKTRRRIATTGAKRVAKGRTTFAVRLRGGDRHSAIASISRIISGLSLTSLNKIAACSLGAPCPLSQFWYVRGLT